MVLRFAILALLAALQPLAFPEPIADRDPLPGKRLTRFGKQYLERALVVAEVEVVRVSRMGLGVDVVTVNPKRILLDHLTARERRERPLLVLCNRGEYSEKGEFLLILAPYGSGRRYTTSQRLPFLDRHYKDKVRVVEQYLEIEAIRDMAARCRALKDLLFKNLVDSSSWVQRNTLEELEAFVRDDRSNFTPEDVARIDALESGDLSESFKQALARIRAAILAKIEKKKE
jgi:hypothetical protein